jgi:hypothetical protein
MNLTAARAAVLAVALAAALLLATATAEARSSETAVVHCGVLVSVHWTLKTHTGMMSGDRYDVAQQGLTCAQALKLAPALIEQKGGEPGRTLRAPTGFHCLSTVGGNNPNAISGVCYRSGRHSFSWGPKLR